MYNMKFLLSVNINNRKCFLGFVLKSYNDFENKCEILKQVLWIQNWSTSKILEFEQKKIVKMMKNNMSRPISPHFGNSPVPCNLLKFIFVKY